MAPFRFVQPLLAAILLVTPLRASADSGLERRLAEAQAACNAGRLQPGLDLLAAIYNETQDPNVFHNQAFCYEANDRPAEAIAKYRWFLKASPDLPAADRRELEQHIGELEAELARRTPKAPVLAAPVPSVDPLRLATAPPKEAPSLYRRPLFWTGVTAVVVTGVVTAVLLTRPAPRRAELCPADCASVAGVVTR